MKEKPITELGNEHIALRTLYFLYDANDDYLDTLAKEDILDGFDTKEMYVILRDTLNLIDRQSFGYDECRRNNHQNHAR